MRRRKSAFWGVDAFQHIYQRASDHGVIFYTIEDRLVYYTLAAVNAKSHNVKIVAASIMYTHIHQAVQASSLADVRAYLRDTDSSFSRLYNFHYSRSGRLFEKPPGMSQKVSLKQKRSLLIYIANNHVEKRLCSEAIQERWSFLAYARSNNPFSDEFDGNAASALLKRACRLVDRRVAKLKGLEYCDLERILPQLNPVEYEQFVDYVIRTYSWIDFGPFLKLFGGFDQMITAVNSTTGGEYDIKEEYDCFSDLPYSYLADKMQMTGMISKIYSMHQNERTSCMFDALKNRIVSFHHLEKFFHEKLTRGC